MFSVSSSSSLSLLLFAIILDNTYGNVFDAAHGNRASRIWGDSQEAEPYQFPYYTYLSTGCGGSLITPDVVMTAAHCSPFKLLKKDAYLLVGAIDYNATYGAEWRYATDVKVPPLVTKKTLKNAYFKLDFDIALIKLNEPYFPENSSDIVLRINTEEEIPTLFDTLEVCGLGRGNFPNDPNSEPGDDDNYDDDTGLFPDVLHYAQLPYRYTNEECNSPNIWDGQVNERMMCGGIQCADELGVCPGSGDSGGPLVKIDGNVHTQVGIVSKGSSDGKNPDIFTRVSSFCHFIKKTVCEEWGLSDADFCSSNCPSPPVCKDGNSEKLEIKKKRKKRKCSWLARQNEKKKKKFCKLKLFNRNLVKDACPKTCNEC